jgi:hypothetical protein
VVTIPTGNTETMADRKQFLNVKPVDPELLRLLELARKTPVTEEMLREQRISFAYGNLMGNDQVTKESVRLSAQRIRLFE